MHKQVCRASRFTFQKVQQNGVDWLVEILEIPLSDTVNIIQRRDLHTFCCRACRLPVF